MNTRFRQMKVRSCDTGNHKRQLEHYEACYKDVQIGIKWKWYSCITEFNGETAFRDIKVSAVSLK